MLNLHLLGKHDRYQSCLKFYTTGRTVVACANTKDNQYKAKTQAKYYSGFRDEICKARYLTLLVPLIRITTDAYSLSLRSLSGLKL